MDDKKKKVGMGLGLGSILGVLYGIDPVKFAEVLSDSMAHEYMRIAAMFTVIAFFHRQGMKKDMAGVTSAIVNLGDALREELKEMRSEILKTNTRVDALEKLKE